jgi:hypothetical protein
MLTELTSKQVGESDCIFERGPDSHFPCFLRLNSLASQYEGTRRKSSDFSDEQSFCNANLRYIIKELKCNTFSVARTI